MSVVKNLYNAIIAELDSIDEVKTSGKWNNQVLNDEREHQFTYPAVFVEINVEWQPAKLVPNSGKDDRLKSQTGLATVILHHLEKKVDYTSATFGASQDTAKKVWDNINDMQGDDYGPLMRINSIDDVDHDIIRDWQEVYQCPIEECPNTANVTDASASATVSVVLNTDLDPGPYLTP